MLAESRDQGPALGDILGGIGYIIGLMGLAAYMRFRRKAGEIAAKEEGLIDPCSRSPLSTEQAGFIVSIPVSRSSWRPFYAFAVALFKPLSPHFFAALAFSFLLMGMSRLPLWDVAKRIVLVNGFVLFFLVGDPLLLIPASRFFSVGPLSVTREGVLVAARITLKSNAILLVFMALIATSSVAVLGAALSRLHVPQKLIQLLLLNYRYIFVMEEEYRRLVRSTAVRGFKPSTGLHTYKTFALSGGHAFRAGLGTGRTGVHGHCFAGGSTGNSIPCMSSPGLDGT